MSQPIFVALIAGACTIISAILTALITKYGLPFWRNSKVIRTKGTASEIFAILPDGSIAKDESGYGYDISKATINLGKNKIRLSAILNATMTTGEVIISDAELTGDGVFMNGVAYITYHVHDIRNAQEWYGLLLLRVPGLGDISGYWIAEDHIKAGHIAMGSICLTRI
ncbi:hypothetical protein [Sulfurirhabdus autotrophica]|uniref:Uncharacterized protein n=1 Tax=Sulfurirhabdus autotrophica TaxID=1706046 RepID=A0A4V2W2Z8_9PROT|nr:hypothetical protein [Sulfurirhabdus autotrophica]TCV90039.1 hypothetical protein EDC63_1013 [Sulfurirhabdus autotrophica]